MKEPPSIWERLVLLIPASFLAYAFLILPGIETWQSYWLMKDGQKGRAEIIRFTPKTAVVYRYWVNQREYTGRDRRTDEERRAAKGNVEEERSPTVYYSASHPWVSRLQRPTTLIPAGLPVLLLAWFLLALMILTMVNPKHNWALQIGAKDRNP
jgi:hypothetical protein